MLVRLHSLKVLALNDPRLRKARKEVLVTDKEFEEYKTAKTNLDKCSHKSKEGTKQAYTEARDHLSAKLLRKLTITSIDEKLEHIADKMATSEQVDDVNSKVDVLLEYAQGKVPEPDGDQTLDEERRMLIEAQAKMQTRISSLNERKGALKRAAHNETLRSAKLETTEDMDL